MNFPEDITASQTDIEQATGVSWARGYADALEDAGGVFRAADALAQALATGADTSAALAAYAKARKRGPLPPGTD